VLINVWLTALVTHHPADQVQLYLIDLKQIELAVYQHLPHTHTLATDGPAALALLDGLLAEVKSRYKRVSEQFKDGIPEADMVEKILKHEKRLVLVIDELAELTLTYPDAVDTLIRLAQIARAAKVNIIAATQRPDVKVCPGNLKTNFDNRLALALPTQTDSRVILDAGGAELLVPPGQALWRSGSKTVTLAVPLLTEEDRNARLRELLQQDTPEQPDAPEQNAAELIEQAAQRLEAAGKRATVRTVYAEVKPQSVTRAAVTQILRDRRVPKS
jgi:DNA segregation ATPase FtsK/SpoIIIE, S-DNA-T family